ncbi:unnamed protein product, partial [Hapterophycus canaliculatus]
MWAGVALCFISQTAVVVTRLLFSPRQDDGASAADDQWSFPGASITGLRGGLRGTMTRTAWAACASVAFLAATLALWATLLAGDGRRAAVSHAANGGGGGGYLGAGGGRGRRGPRDGDPGGGGCRSERATAMGWGDPGAVVMCPGEDMRVLVESVAAAGGPPETRRLCQTCLVQKPMRSKHCSECGLCVGRMDHHCVWLNNCVGCGNSRRFVAFVFCQLAYAALFFSVATVSLVEELSRVSRAESTQAI